jgi:hypothetical protein
MWRKYLAAWAGAASLLGGGCAATGPLLDNPVLVRPDPAAVENPLYVPLGPYPSSYALVFERVLSVLGEYFVIATANRYEGRIVTHPRVAPGYEQFFKAGSPDHRERTLATLQTIRHYAVVKIGSAENGGFWVDVKVYKELEDLPRPTRQTAGSAVFQGDNTLERQYEVVEPALTNAGWIPLGQDESLEQAILEKLKRCM